MMEPTTSYGATVSGQVTWLDLHDADEDEEYEYLPLPEVDEDFVDEEVTATANGRKECMLYML